MIRNKVEDKDHYEVDFDLVDFYVQHLGNLSFVCIPP